MNAASYALPQSAKLAAAHLAHQIEQLSALASGRAGVIDAHALAAIADDMRAKHAAMVEAIQCGVSVQTTVEQALSGLSSLLEQCSAAEVNAQSVCYLIEPQRRQLARATDIISQVL